jgi:hypothetical protein
MHARAASKQYCGFHAELGNRREVMLLSGRQGIKILCLRVDVPVRQLNSPEGLLAPVSGDMAYEQLARGAPESRGLTPPGAPRAHPATAPARTPRSPPLAPPVDTPRTPPPTPPRRHWGAPGPAPAAGAARPPAGVNDTSAEGDNAVSRSADCRPEGRHDSRSDLPTTVGPTVVATASRQSGRLFTTVGPDLQRSVCRAYLRSSSVALPG